MTSLEARWAQLIEWDENAVRDLHAREVAREAANEARRKKQKAPDEWQDLAYIAGRVGEFGMSPYWGQFTAQEIRTERMRSFLAAIWPLWKSQEARRGDADPDYKWVHAADLAIRRSGIKLDRSVAKRGSPSGQELAAGERWHD